MCRRPDCTVAETGVCLLNHEPDACPERVPAEEPAAGVGSSREAFAPSRACALGDARGLMGRRYTQVVGVLGEPGAGKTACLVSLYLLLARGRLRGFRFADSTTLRGFEEISRGARRWDPTRPAEELTEHTRLTSGRSASFLHLRLARLGEESGPFDMLLSDLPGEWTTALVGQQRVDRLTFLRRADAVWAVLDGDELRGAGTRQRSRHRVELLVRRLVGFLGTGMPRLIFVVTRRDHGTLCVESRAHLREIGAEAGLEPEVVEVASFSDGSEEVVPGYGIADLIGRTVEAEEAPEVPLWKEVEERTVGTVEIGLFRGAHGD